MNYWMNNPACWSVATVTAPRDLALPLPLNEIDLKVALVLLFLLHIVFVNLMVGGALLTTIYEILGLKDSKYDALAERVAETVTVNKSMAVVLGVGPLLVISLLYTLQFYTANSLTGHAWILIVPLVTLAFLTTYLHKYTWQTWSGGGWKSLHIGVGVASTILFLAIPWIFLANVNLMQFPESWYDIRGFFSTLKVGNGNVFLRYLHFMGASTAVTAMFLCLWMTRSRRVTAALPDGFSKGPLRRHFYRIAFWVTAVQFAVGPATLLILPHIGFNSFVLTVFLVGAGAGLLLLSLLGTEIRSADHRIGQLWLPSFLVFVFIACSMGMGRQMYRDQALVEHIAETRVRTDEFESRAFIANARRQSGLSAEPDGRELFVLICATCHLPDRAVTAPTSREIIGLYAGKPADIVAWAKKPGKKRPQFPQMPSMAHLGEKRLQKVADFMASLQPHEISGLAARLDPGAIKNLPPEKVASAVLQLRGNSARGKDVFSSRTCISCHILGEAAIRKAPDLSGIGKSQSRQQVIDSILHPSAAFAKGFEPWVLVTFDGEVINGSIVEETPEVIRIRLADGTIREFPAEDIEDRKKGDVSPMPNGLIDVLTPQQAADLLEYLFTL